MYAVLHRRNLQMLFLALLLFMVFLIEGVIIGRVKTPDFRAQEDRVEYLKGLGVEVDSDSLIAEEVRIPSTFSEAYEEYNTLQQEAGFNLYDYKGFAVTKYTYAVLNYDDVYVNVLCYGGKVIGGDVSSAEYGGFMLPLKKDVLGK